MANASSTTSSNCNLPARARDRHSSTRARISSCVIRETGSAKDSITASRSASVLFFCALVSRFQPCRNFAPKKAALSYCEPKRTAMGRNGGRESLPQSWTAVEPVVQRKTRRSFVGWTSCPPETSPKPAREGQASFVFLRALRGAPLPSRHHEGLKSTEGARTLLSARIHSPQGTLRARVPALLFILHPAAISESPTVAVAAFPRTWPNDRRQRVA